MQVAECPHDYQTICHLDLLVSNHSLGGLLSFSRDLVTAQFVNSLIGMVAKTETSVSGFVVCLARGMVSRATVEAQQRYSLEAEATQNPAQTRQKGCRSITQPSLQHKRKQTSGGSIGHL